MHALVELVMRLPGGVFWGLVVVTPVLGLFVFGAAIPVTSKNRALGVGLFGVAIACWGACVLLLVCLVVDIACTGRSGDWIC